MSAGRFVSGDFRPAWWLPGPHLQTLWPALLRSRRAPPLAWETLDLPDGDFVDLCWTRGDGGPIVAVFHGLEGCVQSHYAGGILGAVRAAGWRGVFMHFRGCSGRPNRLARSYHSGDTGDIAFLAETLSRRFPAVPLGAVGVSLGGNALLKYLGETRDRAHFRAAVAVSVPFDLAASADRLSRGMSRIYQRHLLRRLRNKARGKFGGLPTAPMPLDGLRSLDTFRKFDEAVTAPLHGFTGADDYYARSSCRRFLCHIRVPTLIVHARDDPFLTPEAVPAAEELGESVRLELCRSGGHAGFVGGRFPWAPQYWLDERSPAFLREHLR